MPNIPRLKDRPNKRKREPSLRRKERQKYYNTKNWHNLRNLYYESHPLCEDCLDKDIINEDKTFGEKVTEGQDVHHIQSFCERGLSKEERDRRFNDYSNLRTLCKFHHLSFRHKLTTDKEYFKLQEEHNKEILNKKDNEED